MVRFSFYITRFPLCRSHALYTRRRLIHAESRAEPSQPAAALESTSLGCMHGAWRGNERRRERDRAARRENPGTSVLPRRWPLPYRVRAADEQSGTALPHARARPYTYTRLSHAYTYIHRRYAHARTYTPKIRTRIETATDRHIRIYTYAKRVWHCACGLWQPVGQYRSKRKINKRHFSVEQRNQSARWRTSSSVQFEKIYSWKIDSSLIPSQRRDISIDYNICVQSTCVKCVWCM